MKARALPPCKWRRIPASRAGPLDSGRSACAALLSRRRGAGHTKAVVSVKFSNGGERLASASADGTARVWQTLSGECLHVLSGHTQARPAAAPPLSCPARQGRRKACRPAARQGVNDVAWDPSDRYLATASDDRTLILWGAAAGERLRTLEGHTNFVFCCAFNPRQSSLARVPRPPAPPACLSRSAARAPVANVRAGGR